MQPVLFDTSIYITALRTGDESALSLRRLAVDSPVWLSAVVLEELYAGITPRGRHVLERFERDFEKARRILVPNLSEREKEGTITIPLPHSSFSMTYGFSRISCKSLRFQSFVVFDPAAPTTNLFD